MPDQVLVLAPLTLLHVSGAIRVRFADLCIGAYVSYTYFHTASRFQLKQIWQIL